MLPAYTAVMRGVLLSLSWLLLLSQPLAAHVGSRLTTLKRQVSREDRDAARSRDFLMRSTPAGPWAYFHLATPSRAHVKTIAAAIDARLRRDNDHTGQGRWRGVVIHTAPYAAPVMIDRRGRIGNWRVGAPDVFWQWATRRELLGSNPHELSEILRTLADQARKDPFSLTLTSGARSSY